ncbi:MAG: CRISPR-associated endonuclease Cas3'', partial [Firmicutes bacterium]|nr:CRISPR-associated endonuclease Cas3'' [Bacillota bacterium]
MARPTEGEKISYLSEHLEGARSQVCSFLKTMQVNKTTGFLLEIAAVSHDVGKAHHDWQRYIRGKTSSNPNHAKCGAIFFAYLAYHFLQNTGLWEQHQFDWLFITRDIADHHGILKGFVENEGLSSNSFVRIDMAGLANWLYEVFPEMREIGIGITAECINDWQNDYEDIVTDTIYAFYDREEAAARSLDEQMDVLQQWRNHTAKLIAADRFDIEHI